MKNFLSCMEKEDEPTQGNSDNTNNIIERRNFQYSSRTVNFAEILRRNSCVYGGGNNFGNLAATSFHRFHQSLRRFFFEFLLKKIFPARNTLSVKFPSDIVKQEALNKILFDLSLPGYDFTLWTILHFRKNNFQSAELNLTQTSNYFLCLRKLFKLLKESQCINNIILD